MQKISDLPNGTLVLHAGEPYFLSRGLEGRIVTDMNGTWTFVKDLDWETFEVVYKGKKSRKVC